MSYLLSFDAFPYWFGIDGTFEGVDEVRQTLDRVNVQTLNALVQDDRLVEGVMG